MQSDAKCKALGTHCWNMRHQANRREKSKRILVLREKKIEWTQGRMFGDVLHGTNFEKKECFKSKHPIYYLHDKDQTD